MKTQHIIVLVAAAGMAMAPPSRMAESAESSTANKVLTLDGKTGCVRVPVSDSLRSFTNAITVELLFKASSFPPENGYISSFIRKNTSAEKENFLLRSRTIDGNALPEMTPGGHIAMLRASYAFVPGKWYHLAATYDGKAAAIFVNGIAVERQRCAGSMKIDDSELVIGAGDPEFSSGEFFQGDIDEVRLWNLARSQKQIRETINAPLTGKEEGLVAYWNFDDGTANDLSPHANNGKLCGDAGIVSSPPHAIESEEQTTEPSHLEPQELTTEQRIEVLEELWTKLNDIYPALEYKGIFGREWIVPAQSRIRQVESDEQLYNILLELMAGLNDTHTRIISYPGQPQLQSPPVVLNQVEGKIAVIRAHSETNLSPGDVILSIEGRPVQNCLADIIKRVSNSTERGRIREACEQLLRGQPGTTVNLTAQTADEKPRDIALQRQYNPEFWNEPTITSRQLADSVGYIRIARWAGDNEFVDEFDRIMETFRKTTGIILDVRGNGGGDGDLADLVNGRFTEIPVISSIDFWRQSGTDKYQKGIGWVLPRGPWAYKGRIAALTDEASMSSCEHFVSGLEAMGNVLLVGAPTNGAGGGPITVRLSDGTRVAISRALGLRANGIIFEGHGIPPHIFAAPSLEYLRQGRDSALEIAQRWVLSEEKIPPRTQPLPGAIDRSLVLRQTNNALAEDRGLVRR